ncbi:MAG TPA: transcriptional regulator NrdR [Chloroflexota bacterium]|jgi:transcriptional repressor NrdR|nr:transcriptional regulator NrdR [Chloroflexota bacterium]
MRCPFCDGGASRVLDSREAGRGVRRRRVCQNCGQRFTTYESQAPLALTILKRGGRAEGYDRAKLLHSLQVVCYKRPVPAVQIEAAVDRIEAELARLGQSTISSLQLASVALDQLSSLDEIAYLSYASSVRRFHDAEEVLAEIEVLRMLQRRNAEARVQMRLQFDEDQPHWN